MSRTHKDAPDWVRALRNPHHTLVHHDWRCEHSPHGLASALRRLDCPLDTDCDLDTASNPREHRCYRYVDDRTRWYTAAPTRERLHLYYYGPERAAVRDSLRNAARDYNAHGDTEADPPTRQTRRSNWYGGWWD